MDALSRPATPPSTQPSRYNQPAQYTLQQSEDEFRTIPHRLSGGMQDSDGFYPSDSLDNEGEDNFAGYQM